MPFWRPWLYNDINAKRMFTHISGWRKNHLVMLTLIHPLWCMNKLHLFEKGGVQMYEGMNYISNLLREEVLDRWKKEYLVVQ